MNDMNENTHELIDINGLVTLAITVILTSFAFLGANLVNAIFIVRIYLIFAIVFCILAFLPLGLNRQWKANFSAAIIGFIVGALIVHISPVDNDDATALTFNEFPTILSADSLKAAFGGDHWIPNVSEQINAGTALWRYNGDIFTLTVPENGKYFCVYWSNDEDPDAEGATRGPFEMAGVRHASIYFRPLPFTDAECSLVN